MEPSDVFFYRLKWAEDHLGTRQSSRSKDRRILGDLKGCLEHLSCRQMGFIDAGLYFLFVDEQKLNQARRPEEETLRGC